jgi:hypothetical protein
VIVFDFALGAPWREIGDGKMGSDGSDSWLRGSERFKGAAVGIRPGVLSSGLLYVVVRRLGSTGGGG